MLTKEERHPILSEQRNDQCTMIYSAQKVSVTITILCLAICPCVAFITNYVRPGDIYRRRDRSTCNIHDAAKASKNYETNALLAGTILRKNGQGRFGQVISSMRTIAATVTNTEETDVTDVVVTEGPDNIKSAIDEMIKSNSDEMSFTAGDHPNVFGLFGDSRAPHIPTKPVDGTLLIAPSRTMNDAKVIEDVLGIRVAEKIDDRKIAALRLSVFSSQSDLSGEEFCDRSCQIINSRKGRGSVCLVATIPTKLQKRKNKERSGKKERLHERIIGGVECSIHEFYGTKLGFSRPSSTILYITEVAVCPNARRCGIGTKLLKGIDIFARIRDIETLYLHVDVANDAAIALYEQAGYAKVNRDEKHEDFTRSLNLHDGATRGRCHHLMSKHIRRPTLLPEKPTRTVKPGFEIICEPF